jgi:hypothetical protein
LMDIKNHALTYARKFGWKVFPIFGVEDGSCQCGELDCGSPAKHPTQPGGLKNATTDERLINMTFRPGNNVAVATGADSGIFVVDVDGHEGEHSLTQLQQQHGMLPATLVHRTGKGRHFLFKYPAEGKVANSTSKLGPNIDVRGHGGYIVVAPSTHISGVQYRFDNLDQPIAEAPGWLLDLVVKKEAPLRLVSPAPSNTPDEIESMLSALDPDMPYEDWVNVGMALHAEGCDVTAWDSWSRGGQKYRDGDCVKRWQGFDKTGGVTAGTLHHMAWEAGWRPPEPTGPNPAQPFLDKIHANYYGTEDLTVETGGLPDFPIKCLDIPGIIGDTVRWIVASSMKPQPELALMNVLAALGSVIGRDYASPWDTRTNVYMVGLGPTGCGKDTSRKRIKELLVKAGLHDKLAGDSVRSGPGLLRGIQDRPASIMHLDEFGMLLKAINDEKAAGYMREVSKILTELYSSSNSTYHGGTYSDKKIEPIVIDRPHLCIYGTATEETYAAALTRSSIASGEWNRFIVAPVQDDRPQRNRSVASGTPPDSLVAAWTALMDNRPNKIGGNLQGVMPTSAPEPAIVQWGDTEARMHDLGDKEDDLAYEHREDGTSALWMRMRENVIKIAMISAVARNPLSPVLEHDDVSFGEALVQWSIRYMSHIANRKMADSQAEQDCNVILDLLTKHPSGMTRTEISRATKAMSTRRRNDALKELEYDQERIRVAVDGEGKGRKAQKFFLCA